MKKLLFIVPLHTTWESFANPQFFNMGVKKSDGKYYNLPRSDLPLGPLSISAYLKKFMSIDVQLIDFNAEINSMDEINYNNFEEMCLHFLQSNVKTIPDFVGVSSLFSPSFSNFMACAESARNLWPKSIILGGGNIPTNSYEYIYNDLECTSFDGLCFGEGEKPMVELMSSENPFELLEKSSSWITKKKLMSPEKFTPKHDFVWNLDDIPFFDYDLCDFSKHEVNQVVASYHNLDKSRGFHVMTSRGCPFMCTFCASHQTHGRTMRYHSLERVQEDFTRLKVDYAAETVIFQDDHLMADSDRVYKILDIIKQLGLNSVYQNGLTLFSLDRKMLEAFYDAGVRHLVLPVESGSEKVLKKQMKKPLKLKISERVASDCRDLGIYTNTNILIGMPGETKQDLEEARANLKLIVSNWFNIACASPIVGSEIHEISLQNGYIEGDTLGADYRTAVINTEDFTSDFIQEYQYFMNLDLNFVNNSDIKLKNWKWALKGFNNVIKIKEDHALAHYYLAKCYKNLLNLSQADYHYARYLDLVKIKFWGRWAFIFGLEGIDRSKWSTEDFGILREVITNSSENSLNLVGEYNEPTFNLQTSKVKPINV